MKFNLITLSLISAALSTVSGEGVFYVKVRFDEDPEKGCIVYDEDPDAQYRALNPNDKDDIAVSIIDAAIIPKRSLEYVNRSKIYKVYAHTEKRAYDYIHSICNKLSYIDYIGKTPVYVEPEFDPEDTENKGNPEVIKDAAQM